MSRTDGGRCFWSDRVVSRRVVEKGARIYVVCCIHGGSTYSNKWQNEDRRIPDSFQEGGIFSGEWNIWWWEVVKFRSVIVRF